MTHDELVRFAAGKLKIPLREWNGRQVYSNTIARESGWIVLDDGNYTTFGLTSPVLFLKGLEVFEKEGGHWLFSKTAVILTLGDIEPVFPISGYSKITDLPLTFWTAWARLEKGEHP